MPFKDVKCYSCHQHHPWRTTWAAGDSPGLKLGNGFSDFLLSALKYSYPCRKSHYISLLWFICVPFRILFINVTGLSRRGYIKAEQSQLLSPSFGTLQSRGSYLQLVFMICSGATQKEHMSKQHGTDSRGAEHSRTQGLVVEGRPFSLHSSHGIQAMVFSIMHEVIHRILF